MNTIKVILSDDWNTAQEKNIKKIVAGLHDILSGEMLDLSTGGGIASFFVQLKNKHWLGFHNANHDITYSRVPIVNTDEALANMFWEESDKVSGIVLALKGDNFSGVSSIIRSIRKLHAQMSGILTFNMNKPLKTRRDVERFFDWLLFARGVNFHPDDPINNYVNYDTDKRTFTDAEAKILDQRMAETFKIAGDNDKNGVYAIVIARNKKYEKVHSFKKGGAISLPEKGTPEWHQLEIAKKTVRMNPAMVGVMGGMTIEEAKGLLNKYKIKYEQGGVTGYNVYNATDNIFASPDTYASPAEAGKFITEFRQRYENQGYYATADGHKISPDKIGLQIIPAMFKEGGKMKNDESEFYQYTLNRLLTNDEEQYLLQHGVTSVYESAYDENGSEENNTLTIKLIKATSQAEADAILMDAMGNKKEFDATVMKRMQRGGGINEDDYSTWQEENSGVLEEEYADYKTSMELEKRDAEIMSFKDWSREQFERHGEGKFKKGGRVSSDDRHQYYVVAYNTEEDYNKGKPNVTDKNKMNYDEAEAMQNKLLETGDYFQVDIKAFKDNRVVSSAMHPGSMQRGGSTGIPNNYSGKSAEEVWNTWRTSQRLHFIVDHTERQQHTPASQEELSKKAYKFLPADMKKELEKHISWGAYARGGTAHRSETANFKQGDTVEIIGLDKTVNGRSNPYYNRMGTVVHSQSEDVRVFISGVTDEHGEGFNPENLKLIKTSAMQTKIPNNYFGKFPREVWNAWTLAQREHFLNDHLHTIGKGISERSKYMNKKYEDLPETLKGAIETHVSEGQYARGGAVHRSETAAKASHPFQKLCPVGTEIQSVVFDKKKFSVIKAKAWLKKNNFLYGSADAEKNTLRFRQQDPELFDVNSFRTIKLKPSVKAIVACPVNKVPKQEFIVRKVIDGKEEILKFKSYTAAKPVYDALVSKHDYKDSGEDWAEDTENSDNWIELLWTKSAGGRAGKNGYVAFYKGKQTEVYADSSYQAQQKAAEFFHAKKPYEVTVMLAEKEGEQVTHLPLMKRGGKTGQITEDQWWTEYKPEINKVVRAKTSKKIADTEIAPWAGTMYETFGDEVQHVVAVANNPKTVNHVWTLSDDGEIAAGYWLVNRQGYFITEKPWTDKNMVIKLDEYKRGGKATLMGNTTYPSKTWIVNINMHGEKGFYLRKEQITLGPKSTQFDVEQAIARKGPDWMRNGKVLTIYEKKEMGGSVSSDDKQVHILYDKALKLLNAHINNDGNLNFSEKEYSWLNDDLDNVKIGYLKEMPDGTYQEELHEQKYSLTAQEAINMLQHRIENIEEEVGVQNFAVGGAVSETPKQYFTNLLSRDLPAPALEFLQKDILTDTALADLPADNADFKMLEKFINEKYPAPVSEPEFIPEPILEVTPEPASEPIQSKETLKKRLKLLSRMLSKAPAAEKQKIKMRIKFVEKLLKK